MSQRDKLDLVLDRLPAARISEVLNFAEFLSWQEEHDGWQRFGQAQLARAYGMNEPEYTTADLKPERMP